MTNKLCRDVEVAMQHTMKTPKDFDLLRDCIYNRLHVLISSSTLKRIWGYLNTDIKARESSLSTLSRFLGYKDWDDYRKNSATKRSELQSCPVMSRRISVAEELIQGDRLRITWLPDRTLDVIYLGDLEFSVFHSENTRLKEGNIFSCSLIIEGEPLYLDNLCQNGLPPTAYVCGKRSGVTFERLF